LNTKLNTCIALTDRLPLTCTRGGICCYSKTVWLNPWELARLAMAKGMTSRAFRDRYCEFGGIHLRFDGPSGWNGLAACSQYLPEGGCSVYEGRPLACRLFPFGRERRGVEIRYLHQGNRFPCLNGCPEVVNQPYMTVAEYLAGQDVTAGEAAQDAYLGIVQRLATDAFVFLLESGAADSGDKLTLRLWRQLGKEHPGHLAECLGSEWIDRLMSPDLPDTISDPIAFSRRHHNQLRTRTRLLFGKLQDVGGLCEASGLMMGLALYLGSGLGINAAELVSRWIATAKEHGTRE
jgi:Fe-S-cluster containining protein